LALRHYDLAEKDALLVLKTDPKNQMALSLKFASAGRVSPSSADQTAHPSIATAFEPTSSPSHPQSTGIDLNAAATRQHVDSLLREATLKSKIDPTAALPLINKALALDSNNAQIYFLRAAARRAGKDYAGALSDLDEGLRREPGSASAHAARAEISITLGRSVEEIKRDFLATGQSESNFSDYYRLQVAKLAAKNSAAHDRPHATMASGVSGYLKPLFAWQTKKKLFALTLGLILPLLLILIVRRRTSKTQSVPHP
jgi:tetratricopeptide (TPR) repeat protein